MPLRSRSTRRSIATGSAVGKRHCGLLKRTLSGTYVSVDPIHLFRYLDEQMFRFNQRKLKDQERFLLVAAQVIGKRITYAELTGKVQTETAQS